MAKGNMKIVKSSGTTTIKNADDFFSKETQILKMIDSIPEKELEGSGNTLTKALGAMRGFDKKPQIVNKIADGDDVIYRGISDARGNADKYINDFKYGEYFGGQGKEGDGTYFSDNRGESEAYGKIIKAKLSPNAKIIDYDKLAAIRKEIRSRGDSRVKEIMSNVVTRNGKTIFEGEYGGGGLGVLATLMGYDAIVSHDLGAKTAYYTVLNRSRLIVEK